jgi:hypothetical protein
VPTTAAPSTPGGTFTFSAAPSASVSVSPGSSLLRFQVVP